MIFMLMYFNVQGYFYPLLFFVYNPSVRTEDEFFSELKKKLGDIHFYHIFYNMLRENKGYSFT